MISTIHKQKRKKGPTFGFIFIEFIRKLHKFLPNSISKDSLSLAWECEPLALARVVLSAEVTYAIEKEPDSDSISAPKK